MRLQISDRLVNATTHCEKGFSCLNEGKGNFCRFSELNANGTLSVECQKRLNSDCYYLCHTGKQACSCPVRKELYLKYKF